MYFCELAEGLSLQITIKIGSHLRKVRKFDTLLKSANMKVAICGTYLRTTHLRFFLLFSNGLSTCGIEH
jgi:hypothetical protein